MSTERISKQAGYTYKGLDGIWYGPDNKPLPVGSNGKPLCRQCGGEVTAPGRRTFCSPECSDEWQIRTSPSYVRTLVYRRDKGVCALCGVNTGAERAAFLAAWRGRSAYRVDREHRDELKAECVRYAEAGWPTLDPSRSWWDADHALPVVEGGGCCGIENYRTLCVPCHKKETAKLARRLSAKRKGQTLMQLPAPAADG